MEYRFAHTYPRLPQPLLWLPFSELLWHSRTMPKRGNARPAPEVSQKNKAQTAYTKQGQARPEIEQKAGRTGVKQRVQQQVEARWNAGQCLSGDQKVMKVAGLARATAQDGALE